MKDFEMTNLYEEGDTLGKNSLLPQNDTGITSDMVLLEGGMTMPQPLKSSDKQ